MIETQRSRLVMATVVVGLIMALGLTPHVAYADQGRGGGGSGGSGSGSGGSGGSGSGGSGSHGSGSSGGSEGSSSHDSGSSGGSSGPSSSSHSDGPADGHSGTGSTQSGPAHASRSFEGGWREQIRNGRYELYDPVGRLVIRRQARKSDYGRF